MTDGDPIEKSCIKTELKVPTIAVRAWLLKTFPDLLHDDAKIVQVWSSGGSHVDFTIEHTEQAPKQARPILLAPPPTDDDPPDNPMSHVL